MKDFVKMAGAVAVGTLVASCVALGAVCNKKLMTAYTKKVMEVSMEATEEMMKTMYEE